MLRFGGWLVSSDVVLFCNAIGVMWFGSQSLRVMWFRLHIVWGSRGFVCTYFGDHAVLFAHILGITWFLETTSQSSLLAAWQSRCVKS